MTTLYKSVTESTDCHLDIFMTLKELSAKLDPSDEDLKLLFKMVTNGNELTHIYPLFGMFKEPSTTQKVHWYLDWGYSPAYVAERLEIAPQTVSYHRNKEYTKNYHHPTINYSLFPDYKTNEYYPRDYIDSKGSYFKKQKELQNQKSN